MILSIVVAAAENNAIGKNNQLLWHLPADLKFFKQLTTGHTIIMGRKTYESIGKPLPNRRSIVISRNKDYKIEGAEVVSSVEEAIKLCKYEEEAFLIGGAEIYKYALPLTNRIYLTRVHTIMKDADAFFPQLNDEDWRTISQIKHESDEKNPYSYSIIVLDRINH